MLAWGRCVVGVRGCLLLIGLMGLAGCASVEGYPKRVEDSQQYVTEVDGFVSPTVILKYNADVINPPPGVSPAQLMVERNTIVTARIYAIDVNYHNFVRDLTTQQNVGNVGTDWVVLALSGIGATAGSAAAKAALAAASGGVVGARAAVNKDVYFNNTVTTLITTMEGQRKTVLATIYTGLQKGVADYTIYQAMADLDDYYNAGTINGALIQLANAASEKLQTGNAQVTNALTVNFQNDAASQKLLAYWMPGGTVNSANQTKILSWMSTNNFAASIVALVNGKQFASQRAKAVKDLGL
jgi:hypothetical protein